MALDGSFTLYDLDGLTHDDPFFSTVIGVPLRVLQASDAQPVAGEQLVLFNPATGLNEGYTVIASSSGGLLLADSVQVYMLGDAGIAQGSVLQSDVSVANVPCFAAGTRIATASGEVPVEALQPGDLLQTVLGRGLQPVTWVGSTACALRARRSAECPVRIQAGAFAPGQPVRDLVLSPDHAVLAGGRLVPVRHLVNGASIAHDRHLGSITYYHVELPHHDVVLAEGLPAETYLDTGNRHLFAGAAVPHLHLALDGPAAIWEAHGCLELLVEGPDLATLHRRLCARAATLGHRRTADPGLRLEADGRAVDWSRCGPEHYEAALPPGAGTVRLLSRRGPAHHLASGLDDRRSLGVALAGAWLDGAALRLDDPAWTGGLHPAEPGGHRWTDGAASLTLAPVSRPRALVLRLHAGWREYWEEPARLRRSA